MFILEGSVKARGADIGAGWAGSLTMGAGQFCTNPGIVVIPKDQADVFATAAAKALEQIGTQTMLTDGIASAFRNGQSRIASSEGVQGVLTTNCDGRGATPYLYQTTAAQWLANDDLGEEVFGPLGLIFLADDLEQMRSVAHALRGQLTCTLHIEAPDEEAAKSLMPILERKAGRILANGFPTGVEVSEAMVHGGPYPASTNFGATSVGTMSIRRFIRPVCYQDMPLGLLPD
jgi:2,5-dioxopentanoate dehydrogenase